LLVQGEACWAQLQQLTALMQLSRLIHHVTGSADRVSLNNTVSLPACRAGGGASVHVLIAVAAAHKL
jgi:hypothetical protein